MSDINDMTTILRIGMEGSYYLLKGSAKGTLLLIQTLGKLIRAYEQKKLKEGLVSGKELTSFQGFLKLSEGKYEILSIPTEKVELLNGMKADFQKSGITYMLLPDLNKGDGYTQVAYAFSDQKKVQAWYQGFLTRQLKGGSRSKEDLMKLTEGQVQIVNIPWDEKKTELLKEDLTKLGVNYAILPDLTVGDGYVQVMYASFDAPQVKAWYEAYRNNILKSEDKDIGTLQNMEMKDYMETGKLREQDYTETASQEIQKIIQPGKQEQQNQDFMHALERRPMGGLREEILSAQEYKAAVNAPGAMQITLNEELLAGKEEDIFLFRIPQTQGKEFIALSSEELYRTDQGKTYLAVLAKDKEYAIFNIEGKKIKSKKGAELQENFAKVKRSFPHIGNEKLFPSSKKTSLGLKH